jgi:hypothetical protein
MPANPYAPPKARVADVESTSHGLEKRSVLVMIVLTFITFGTYFLIWWFRRRPGLNRLDSPAKVPLWPLLLMAALWVAVVMVGVLDGLSPDGRALSPGGNLMFSLVQLAVGISMLIQAFKVKGMIEDHVAPADSSQMFQVEQVKLSGLMTFFFSIFYLHWAINRYVIADAR